MKKWTKRRKILVIWLPIILLVIISIPVITSINRSNNEKNCEVDTGAFLIEVNQIRASEGIPAISYSDQLEEAAQARLLDMQKNNYYGHTNPTTKQQSYDFAAKFEPAANNLGEILDDPSQASKAFNNFVNSPEHKAIIVDKTYNYMGVASIYNTSDRPSYDNSGNSQGFMGALSERCTVVAEFSDK